LLATLPGDFHRLGLHMVAVTLAAAEAKITYIGPQTPPRELVVTCERLEPAALCLSISATMDPRFVARTVEDLRQKIAQDIPIVVGGKGAPMPHTGVLRISDFQEFYDWIRGRREAS
jgi:cobalamin-dependent methionine synthase I